MRGAAALIGICLASSAWALAPSGTLTLREARTLPVTDLAARVLGMAGDRAREAMVWSGAPPFGSSDRLSQIDFATAPDRSGEAGLCAAWRITVEFVAPGRQMRDPGDLPSRALLPERRRLWGVLADVPPEGTALFDRARDDAQVAACARLAPVLRRGAPRTFFPIYDKAGRDAADGEVRLVASILRVLDPPGIDDAIKIACRPTACTSPREALASFDTVRPEQVEIAECDEQSPLLCIKARYGSIATGDTSGSYSELRVAAERVDRPGGNGAVRWTETSVRVRAVVIARVSWVA